MSVGVRKTKLIQCSHYNKSILVSKPAGTGFDEGIDSNDERSKGEDFEKG